jgi:hypothetical protein
LLVSMEGGGGGGGGGGGCGLNGHGGRRMVECRMRRPILDVACG